MVKQVVTPNTVTRTFLFSIPDGWQWRLTDKGVVITHPQHPPRERGWHDADWRELKP